MAHTVLIVTDNDSVARQLNAVVTSHNEYQFAAKRVASLAQAVESLHDSDVEIVLADLSVPDSLAAVTVDRLFAVCSADTCVAVVVDAEDEGLARTAVSKGAFGYVFKDRPKQAATLLRNIVRCRSMESALALEKRRARTILDSLGDGVITADVDGVVTYLNPAAEVLTGWLLPEALGQPITEVFKIIDTETRMPAASLPLIALEERMVKRPIISVTLLRRDQSTRMIEDSSSPIRDSSGQLTGVAVVFHDVTDAHATAAKLFHLAHHDHLTGLPNRLLMIDRLEQALGMANRSAKEIAVLSLDLDGFKHINDSLGHVVGDMLLQSVAQRLCRCVRKTDTVCRQGGDEFVILVSDDRQMEHVAIVAQKIVTALAESHHVDGHELYVSASIGISIYPHHGKDTVTLLKNADTALYRAKAAGRNRYEFFQDSDNQRAVQRQSLEAELRLALKEHQFCLYYQPKFDLRSGQICGVEALLRWQHPERGFLAPGEFLWVAEECGLIVDIDRWVKREAFRQAKERLDAGLRPVALAINASALEFHDPQFIPILRGLLEEFALESRCIEFEMTEGVLMQDGEASIAILWDLKKIGVQLAVDDFGTGYSSLSYLRKFPIDAIKIDQSFVRDIAHDKKVGDIVASLCALARQLNQRVVAEGIETAEQLEFLQACQCDEGQGYYLSRPLNAADFSRLLEMRKVLPAFSK